MKEESGQNSLVKEREFVIEEEGVLADVIADIDWIRESKNISRRDLAARLGVSEARVSKIFSSNGSNLTLRTAARLFFALGERLKVTSAHLEVLRQQVAAGSHWHVSGETGSAEPQCLWASTSCVQFHSSKPRVRLRISETAPCSCDDGLKVA